MPAIARADIESLLRLRKLDHTLANTLTDETPDPTLRWVVPTGIRELDARLHGGFPRGHLSECVGPRSSGRLAMMVSALAEATRRGEAVALVDPLDLFDPASAAATGIDFARMLWIRGEALSASRVSLSCEYGTLQKSLDRGVKALNLVLQAGGFGLAVIDLAEIAPHVIGRLPFTTWLRLHRVIEGSETACVLVASEPVAKSAGGVTVRLERPGKWNLKLGTVEDVRARVMRARAMETCADVRVPVSAAAG